MKFKEAPIGAVFDVRNGATPVSENPAFWDGDISWVGPVDLGQLTVRHIEHGKRSITHAGYTSCGTQLVPPGTILLSTRAPIGHVAIASREICFNQGCRGLVPRNAICSDFAYWALLARIPQLEAAGQGTTFLELSRDKLKAARIPLPDLPTQKAIADFLDRETARIDQLIEKKQRMVEVLEEKRIAAITDLFCGVRAAGCKSFRLRYLLSQPLKYGANEAADSDDPNDVRFIRITDFRSDGTLREETFKSLPIEKAQEYLLEEGDILFARSGATVGKTFIYEESFGPCCFAGYLIRARLNRKKVVPQFVKALTETSEYWNLIGLSNIQATIQNVNAKKYAQLNVPAPPVEAQEKIVGVYKDILSRYKHLKANIDRSADRLREFRSALITASVTGEIDVSTWGKQRTIDRRLDQIEEAASA